VQERNESQGRELVRSLRNLAPCIELRLVSLHSFLFSLSAGHCGRHQLGHSICLASYPVSPRRMFIPGSDGGAHLSNSPLFPFRHSLCCSARGTVFFDFTFVKSGTRFSAPGLKWRISKPNIFPGSRRARMPAAFHLAAITQPTLAIHKPRTFD
jgi:hypothetical protein